MQQNGDSPDTPDTVRPEGDRLWSELTTRADELRAAGLSRDVAFGTAELEARISKWPKAWGNELQALIFGDFYAPTHDLQYPALGITIEAGNRKDTVIKTALCVVTARVVVQEKSLQAVQDAAARLNTLLGVWTIVDWGNRGVGWWCYLTNGIIGAAGGPFEKAGIDDAIDGIERMDPKVQAKIRAALYWIREPKKSLPENHKSDIFNVYSGYWNAFECLVDAVCLIRPRSKMKPQEKLDGITMFLADRDGILDIKSLTECYQTFVNPGFPAKASHALHVCFDDRADGYIQECFRAKPEEERLYAVRNAINHGGIDSDSVQEIFRVQERSKRLKMIVFGMLGRLVPFSYPVDSGPEN